MVAPLPSDKFKKDKRPPQKLATAILDTAFIPATGSIPSVSFRGFLASPNPLWQIENKAEVLEALQYIEKTGKIGNKTQQDNLSYGLEVIAASRTWATQQKTAAQKYRNTPLSTEDHDFSEFVHGMADDNVTLFAEAIRNLSSIESLMNTLASKLGVQLIPPRSGGK